MNEDNCARRSHSVTIVSATVAWICKWMRYDEEVLCQRVSESWFVLLVAFPVHWVTIAIVVFFFGVGSGWEPWYLLVIIPHSLNMLVHSPLSLRYDVKQLSESWIESLWGALFVHGGGYCMVLVSLIGYLGTTVKIPFNSVTWTTVGLLLVAPLMCLVDRITNFAPTAVRGGNTPVSILLVNAADGMRLVDPLADFVLGLQLLQQAKKHVCPWNRGSEPAGSIEASPSQCRAHHIIAWIIMIASVFDLLTVAAYVHVLKPAFKGLPDSTKQLTAEVIMLLCELCIVIAVILVSRFNMLVEDTAAAVGASDRDLKGYVALCSFSTFGSLLATVLSLVVPTSFWQRLEADGPVLVWQQVFADFSTRAYCVRRGPATSVHGASSHGGRSASTVAPCPPSLNAPEDITINGELCTRDVATVLTTHLN